ncbi:hypothetical protein ICW40_09690 [Actinotalea ferrariae]|uniref:hypothetical protein n=1 Tax=Actinotalea ferrariae TaxID=1386098 RepID=UPI001C8CC4B5|nr:hypothetical protein [Actinotalea ferrariae]MBX9245076.1 hypothetical protein [Actinotalea ferrariae]
MKKTLTVAALSGLLVLAAGTPALAAKPAPKNDPAPNKVAYWEAAGFGTCSKVELRDGHKTFTVDGTPTVLVLKAGSGASAQDVVVAPEAGVAYAHSTGKDLSHVITCVGDGSEVPGEAPGDGPGEGGGPIIIIS